MSEHILDSNRYSIGLAKWALIGEEWNDIVWDRNHPQIQYHRLYLPTSGNATLHLYDKTVELLPGNIYFIPAFSIVQSRIDGEMNKYYIHFLADSPMFGLYRYLSDRCSVPADGMSEYLFKTVVDNFTSNTHESYMKVHGAMNLLLAPFFSDVSADRHSLIKFEGVLKFIDDNYKKDIRLSELASIMNISTMYFSNYFKQVFHISPKQYILNKRLSESQRLLLESDLSIKEIAYAVGFENESYFSEFFSKKVGVSALRFRNRDMTGSPAFNRI